MKKIYILILFFLLQQCSKWNDQEDSYTNKDAVNISETSSDNEIILNDSNIINESFSFQMTYSTAPEEKNIHFELVNTSKEEIIIDIFADGLSDVFGIAGYITFPSNIIELNNITLSELFGPDGNDGIYRTALLRNNEITFVLSRLKNKTNVKFNEKPKIGTITFKPIKTGAGLLHFIRKNTIAIQSDGSEIDLTPTDSKIELTLP